jgi:hypothetical protein
MTAAMATVKKKDIKEILLGLEKFSDDEDWISEKQTTLRKKFADKYIAVVGNRVIDSDSRLDVLLKRLKKRGDDPSQIAIEFISLEPPRLIL